MPDFRTLMEYVVILIEGTGVLVVLAGIVIGALRFARGEGDPDKDRVGRFREDIGRAILLSLELLVAADIVRTVVVEPTLVPRRTTASPPKGRT